MANSYVDKIFLRDFRNIKEETLSFGSHFNIVSGENGSGKSNLLEAIYYAATLKSFRGAKKTDLVFVDSEQASLRVVWEQEPMERSLSIDIHKKKSRKLSLDGKKPRSLSSWITNFPIVLFHPGQMSFSMGAASQRRAFLNATLCRQSESYARDLKDYQVALRSKSKLLKNETVDRTSIAAYDEILVEKGLQIIQKRKELVGQLSPHTEEIFQSIFGQETELSLSYLPKVKPSESSFRTALDQSFFKDCARGYSSVGPHSDDLELKMKGQAVRYFASQGQHRAVLLALKVAEVRVTEERLAKKPVVLLDDVSSELDRQRNRRFFEVLRQENCQVFLTTTHPEFILLDEGRCDWRVSEGTIKRE